MENDSTEKATSPVSGIQHACIVYLQIHAISIIVADTIIHDQIYPCLPPTRIALQRNGRHASSVRGHTQCPAVSHKLF